MDFTSFTESLDKLSMRAADGVQTVKAVAQAVKGNDQAQAPASAEAAGALDANGNVVSPRKDIADQPVATFYETYKTPILVVGALVAGYVAYCYVKEAK